MTAVARFYRDYENIIFISFGAFIFNFSKSIINVYNIRLYSRSQRDKHPFLFAFYAIKFITVLESTLNGEPKNVIYNYLWFSIIQYALLYGTQNDEDDDEMESRLQEPNSSFV